MSGAVIPLVIVPREAFIRRHVEVTERKRPSKSAFKTREAAVAGK
jgi:hypothetical protein